MSARLLLSALDVLVSRLIPEEASAWSIIFQHQLHGLPASMLQVLTACLLAACSPCSYLLGWPTCPKPCQPCLGTCPSRLCWPWGWTVLVLPGKLRHLWLAHTLHAGDMCENHAYPACTDATCPLAAELACLLSATVTSSRLLLSLICVANCCSRLSLRPWCSALGGLMM